MALDFSRYLDVAVESIEAPKPLVLGHYFATIKAWKGEEVEYQKGTKTPIVRVTFALTAADTDVDESLLPPNYIGRTVDRNYTLNDESGQFQLRKLAEDTCELPVKGLHLGDLLPTLIGQPVRVYIEMRPGSEEGQFFPQVKKVLSANG